MSTTPEVTSSKRTHPLPSREERVLGTVLGGTIGDAMGNPTEFMSMADIHEEFGPKGVTEFVHWEHDDGRRFAPYTDDTQLAEVVLRALLDARGLELDATMTLMAQRFVEWSRAPLGGHRSPGRACLEGCRALASGVHWSIAGGPTAGGCGSVMRTYPFGLVLTDELARAEAWAVEHSKLTHRDPIALASCAAMALGVAHLVRGARPADAVDEMVRAAARYSEVTAEMISRAARDATAGVPPSTTLDRLRGWAAHEAIAAAVYVLLRHAEDPRAAILEGANTPGDSDSIASIAGALVGAHTGVAALPPSWVRDVERSDELATLARRAAALDPRRA
ncbi:ADP-ribosylglycohydrolase family protein [Myxococcota bacterium]|nr:ADP-ribosylglycohydrolase family protein [Myxococcota bacterium]